MGMWYRQAVLLGHACAKYIGHSHISWSTGGKWEFDQDGGKRAFTGPGRP